MSETIIRTLQRGTSLLSFLVLLRPPAATRWGITAMDRESGPARCELRPIHERGVEPNPMKLHEIVGPSCSNPHTSTN
jgi:hypothetical protein